MWSSAPASRARLPRAGSLLRTGFDLKPGMRVGLYGGSFDPAHDGHRHVAETALRRLNLDRVIWLVSPGNPLKPAGAAGDFERRLGDARRMAAHPRMSVSGVERAMGSRFTIETLRAFQARYPGVHFVWIMGADNLAGFHHWRGWIDIFRLLPVAVVDRPGSGLKSRLSPAARRFAAFRLPQAGAHGLARRSPPAWVYLTAPLNPASSSHIRRRAEGAITP